jgi:POT family proton-dependent oligopeptide transporter
MPVGAYVADQYWGRFKIIQAAIGIALIGHIILIISAIPAVIVHPSGSIACFAIGIVDMGIGVGGFKSNTSPLMAEQCMESVMRIKTKAKGERVIMDPAVTISRVMLYFYLMINIGSLTGSIGMVYAEKYVGFWLSYLLPILMLCEISHKNALTATDLFCRHFAHWL